MNSAYLIKYINKNLGLKRVETPALPARLSKLPASSRPLSVGNERQEGRAKFTCTEKLLNSVLPETAAALASGTSPAAHRLCSSPGFQPRQILLLLHQERIIPTSFGASWVLTHLLVPFLITENASGFLLMKYLNQKFWIVVFFCLFVCFWKMQEQPDSLPTPPPPPWIKLLFCGLWVIYRDLFLLRS